MDITISLSASEEDAVRAAVTVPGETLSEEVTVLLAERFVRQRFAETVVRPLLADMLNRQMSSTLQAFTELSPTDRASVKASLDAAIGAKKGSVAAAIPKLVSKPK